MTAKMSKSKKKKLKKRAKRNQALMEETMQHIVEKEQEQMLQEQEQALANSSIDEPQKEEEDVVTESTVVTTNGKEPSGGDGDDGAVKVNGQGKKEEEEEEEGGFVEEAADEAKVDDIEKRKSFADMKLAVVASGGSFSFDRDVPPMEGSNGKKTVEAPAEATVTPASDDDEGGLQMGTPTKQKQDNSSSSFDSPDSPKAPATGVGAVTNGGLRVAAPERAEDSNSLLSVGSEGALSMGGSSTKQREKLDPVVEVCPDLEVKIADLGNACWVVSSLFKLRTYCGFVFHQITLSHFLRIITLPRIFRRASTAVWRCS